MKENDRMPIDYRIHIIIMCTIPILYFYIVLMTNAYNNYYAQYRPTLILYTMLLLMIFSVLYMHIISYSPVQKLAKRDFKNNYKDNKLYSICNDYKDAYDSIKKEYDEIESRENNRYACKKAINERFKKM